ncbi:MAG: tetratricopeptide repeat protein [Parachlamydiaceae bacterium]
MKLEWRIGLIAASIITLALISILTVTFVMRTGDDRISQAEESYRTGESATTIAGRQEAFNRALDMFLAVEIDHHPRFGNGHLYFDIGNTYFQLGQYPLAILNYLRAKELMPRNEAVSRNLAVAQKKLSVNNTSSQSILDTVFLSSTLSLPERLQLFFATCVIALLLCSGWVWTRYSWYWNSSIVTLSLVAILSISLSFTRYIAPVRAVLVHAVELRRDAGTAFSKVGDFPIPAGSVVVVLDISPDSSWLKIATPSGTFGYAPQASVAPIF